MTTHPTVVRAVTLLLLVASVSASHAAGRAPARVTRHTAKQASVAAARPACAPCPACPTGTGSTACRPTSGAATASAPAPGVAGMVVGIDPETGALGRPSAEQMLQLSAIEKQMLSRSMDGLVEKPLPGGGFGIDLQGRFQEFSFVRLGPGGKFVFQCQSDADRVRQALTPPVQPALEDR